MATGRVAAVCTSHRKGEPKRAVERATLIAGQGLQGDAHAGTWHRQVSLLAEERVDELRGRGMELPPGAFGENLVTRGLDLDALKIGRRIRVGERAVVQLTQRGKECHDRCAIFHKVGDCVMPRAGLFARVRRGGEVAAGDPITTDADLDRLRYAVVTLSDRAVFEGREDRSGPVIRELLQAAVAGTEVARVVLPDEQRRIEDELRRLAPRDVTPEATRAVIHREVPGMAEAMRAAGLAKTPHAMLSRGVCGLRGQTLIINLSGSPKAVREQLESVLPALPHAVQTAAGIPQDCAR